MKARLVAVSVTSLLLATICYTLSPYNKIPLSNPAAYVKALNMDTSAVYFTEAVSGKEDYFINAKVKISTIAFDPENDPLTYNYYVSAGKIEGEGESVVWNLNDVNPGIYSITAGVDDGCGVCGDTKTRFVSVLERPADTRARIWRIVFLDIPPTISGRFFFHNKFLSDKDDPRLVYLSSGTTVKHSDYLTKKDFRGIGDVDTMPVLEDLKFDLIRKFEDCPPRSSKESCDGSIMKILISVDASDFEYDPLTFNYKTLGGKIDGTGSKVIWDLSNEKSGHYAIEVCADGGIGCGAGINIASAQVRIQ